MSKRLSASQNAKNTNKIPIVARSSSGIVTEVILDSEHERVVKVSDDYKKEYFTEKETDVVGYAVIRPLDDNTSAENSLFTYRPLSPSLLEVPLVGEIVELYKIGNVRYYRRYSSVNINKGNAGKDRNKVTYQKTDKSSSSKDYNTVAKTNTPNNSSESDRSTVIGEYFEPQQVNKLKLYEGDSILQSRFGQSIRFSGYNNEENKFSPTITIRNRQNDESINNLKEFDLVEEDVNKDGSIIALTSQDYKIPFQPGLIDDGGSSNFETTPLYAEIPEEYVGQDQILINSERIIISSKAAEMMFFSKGNYSIISDGDLSMDFGFGGAKLDFGGEVILTTDRNSSNVSINTGDGQIRLNTDDSGNGGTGQKEPIARGETLVDLLSQLIDAIGQQIFATPAGPTAAGPLNIAIFKKIQSQLDTIKSTKNFTE
jgi:hypothetical protein